MTKQGFYFDLTSCSGCRTCQVACKDKNALGVGTLFRHVHTFETGAYPEARLYSFAATCNHCMNPACVEACPNSAMYIDEEDGTVQHDDSKCIGCQYCVKACPYGVPQYIEESKLTHKCDGCIQLRKNGEVPACVAACPMRAIEFGSYDELLAAHPEAVSDVAVLPNSAETSPCTLINPKPAALEQDYRPVSL
ncbi:4Fe-4S dicluster domain-containing protein [Paraeggerthella hongkongensis]|uniref:4Fe-4S ferredoxin n=1 Tax=Paraeggerthella hongkongensis TaxID=230658 RepID=A0A3N0BC49_9ACTN|nr:4Fe-4S dicluster domain-containing protein [Paraeggerthella hongkongensis]RNL45060.1 4Fe-4S ferredoxin [Paraeggerthella hongkongensis]